MGSTASHQSRAPGIGTAISVRRSANDEIARIASLLDADEGHLFEFLCECGDLSCIQFVKMTVAEYRASWPGSLVGHPISEDVGVPAVSQRQSLDAARLAAANELALRHVRDSDDGGQEWEFLCECGREGCDKRVLLTIDAYIALHNHAEAVLADGHQVSQTGRVRAVRSESRWSV